jgi:hypothetical protein
MPPYARGTLRVDLHSRSIELLPCPDTVAVLGVDGLSGSPHLIR